MNKFSFVTLTLLAGVGCAVACSSSGDDTAVATGGTGGSAGKSSGGSGGTTSSTAGKGGGTTSEAGAGGGSTLYERLGGATGIDMAIKAIVTAEAGDDDIGSYFAPNLTDKTHMPQPADIIECLDLLLGSASGGPEKYPGTTSSGFTCRSMTDAHATLGINSGTFDKFVMIAGATIKGAVSDDDLTTIAGVLNGTKTSIVTDTTTTAARPCQAPASCAAEAGAGGAG